MASERCVKLMRMFFTEKERSDAVLCNQLHEAEKSMGEIVSRPLEDFQKDALLCLIADVQAGLAEAPSGSFPSSFLIKAVNRGMFQIAAAEFHSFCYVKGRLDSRAWNKRKAEQLLFSRGVLLFG
jgi:GH24 family phage-related lysozyme (muramidase)